MDRRPYLAEDGCCKASDNTTTKGNSKPQRAGFCYLALLFFCYGTKHKLVTEFVDSKLTDGIRDLSTNPVSTTVASKRGPSTYLERIGRNPA